MTHKTLTQITNRIIERSEKNRTAYLEKLEAARIKGVARAHLTCGNQAHAYAAMGADQGALAQERVPNIGIITAYNDMLSAHQPYARFPDLIKDTARQNGATAQVAGGVPAMCDGVTQGQAGMELSLFSRDVIALAASVGLSHNCYDRTMYLGVCDKIVPGLVMAAATFGHIPGMFVPAGPMTSGIPNDEKAAVRKKFAEGKVGRDELMKSEMASYHGPGTCTFYGTANSNQMLMEFMGLHLPGSSFVNPNTDMRDALTAKATQQILACDTPLGHVLDEKAFVNGIVGLMATGGSTNLILHLPAMARAAGVVLDMQDFSDIAEIVPLMARVYPNGLADVNHFHAAGGLPYMIHHLLDAGLLHGDVQTIMGAGLDAYRQEPQIEGGEIHFVQGAKESRNDKILRPCADAFQATGGLKTLTGNLGRAVIKTSAVDPARHVIEAPARVFHTQLAVKEAFQNGEFNGDVIVVVRYQGPAANGMPELHNLTPVLSVLQDRGLKVALVTDGRMSGASGKVPAAIHLTPEAAQGGAVAQIADGDMLRLDAVTGVLENLSPNWQDRPAAVVDLGDHAQGLGRELFDLFRTNVSNANHGASPIL